MSLTLASLSRHAGTVHTTEQDVARRDPHHQQVPYVGPLYTTAGITPRQHDHVGLCTSMKGDTKQQKLENQHLTHPQQHPYSQSVLAGPARSHRCL
jgi:hypothetical protein